LKEKIETVTIASLIISIFGLFLIFYTPDAIANFWGYLSGFLAGFFMSIVLIIGKILSKKYDQMTMTFFQNIIALPLMLPLLFFAEFDWSFVNLSTLVVLGILCTGIAFLLLYSGMKKVKSQKVGILLLLEVVTPIFLVFVVFQEIPSLREIIGGMMILIGFIIIAILSSNIKEEIEY
jgi:drug/metabolite transporter (DMT)-like permease